MFSRRHKFGTNGYKLEGCAWKLKRQDSGNIESYKILMNGYLESGIKYCNDKKDICVINVKKIIKLLRVKTLGFISKNLIQIKKVNIMKYLDNKLFRACFDTTKCLVDLFGTKIGAFLNKLDSNLNRLCSKILKEFSKVLYTFKEDGAKLVCKEFFTTIKKMLDAKRDKLFKLGYMSLPIAALTILFATVVYWNNADYGLVVAYDGEEIATICDEKVIEQANQMVNKRLVYDSVWSSDKNIEFVPTYKLAVVSSKKYSTPSVVCDKIIQQSKGSIEEASGLYIDNELLGVVENDQELDSVLNSILDSATDREDADVNFVENIEKVNGLYLTESIVDSEELMDKLSKPIDNEVYYTIKDGDTPSEIAENFNMDLEELERINDNKLEELIYPDEQVKVQVAKKLLNVSISYIDSYENSIPYDVEETEDSNQYKGYSLTTQEGEDGIVRCSDKVVFVNGVEVSREEVSRETTKEPVSKKVTVGTKVKQTNNYSNSTYSGATTTGSGSLMWPVPYTRCISSPFGMRDGGMHSGIDISSGGIYGQNIVAADTGTVTSVQFLGYGYGYHVRINHGNGISTLYAHCSNIYVSAGQTVSKGQAIAAVGSTGDSTGPHLHFEVIVNGSRVNPLSYV